MKAVRWALRFLNAPLPATAIGGLLVVILASGTSAKLLGSPWGWVGYVPAWAWAAFVGVVVTAAATAVMFGRTLEAIVAENGSAVAQTAMADRSLAAGLLVMSEEKDPEPALAEWAGELRLARNAAGHFNPLDDVLHEEASELSKLLRELLKFLFEVPAQLRRTKATAHQGGRA